MFAAVRSTMISTTCMPPIATTTIQTTATITSGSGLPRTLVVARRCRSAGQNPPLYGRVESAMLGSRPFSSAAPATEGRCQTEVIARSAEVGMR